MEATILEEFSYSVKQLAEKHRFASVSVDSDEEEALQLVHLLEAVFLHGSLSPKGLPWSTELQAGYGVSADVVSFWPFLEGRIGDDDMERLHALRYVDSDVRKCKTWLRMVLNSQRWLAFLKEVVDNQRALSVYYEDSAFLRNQLPTSTMINDLKKIAGLKFQFTYTGPDMMSWSESTLQLSGLVLNDDSDSNGDDGGRISPPDSGFPSTRVDGKLPVLAYQSMGQGENYQFREFERTYRNALKVYSELPTPSWRQEEAQEEEKRDDKSNSSHLVQEGTSGITDESFQLAKDYAFEIVNVPFSMPSTAATEKGAALTLTSMLTVLTNERGMDAQDYKCASCKKPIGMIFDCAKVCHYTSQYFCMDCHCDEERYIPAKIIFNWDFSKYTVASHSAAFLDSIAFEPLFDLQEINHQLYIYVPELREVKNLRIQLHHLKNFILTCREEEVKASFLKKFSSSYLYNNVNMYSMGDLCKVDNGQLAMRLRKGVGRFRQHVRRCELCSVKGFICELCHQSEVIYPFELDDTYQCKKCHSVFHQLCWKKQHSCPRCVRIEQKSSQMETLPH